MADDKFNVYLIFFFKCQFFHHSTKQNSNSYTVDKENGGEKKIPYPKSILFIIGNEFCERFSFYGMRSKFQLDDS